MPATFQTSFIPKKSLVESSKPKTSGVNLIALGSVVIFTLALGASAAVFLYGAYLKGNIAAKEKTLAKEKEAYEPATIEELRRLDGRIESAKDLLKNHVALSGLLGYLSKATLESVRFTSFEYSYAADGTIKLSMDGEAESFGSIALQSDEFAKSRYVKEPIFSNLNLDQDGNVVFDFTASVEPSLVSYERMILESAPSEGGAAETPEATVPTAPSGTSPTSTPAL
jgi:hypothetical protein